jgi:hypothetical protein
MPTSKAITDSAKISRVFSTLTEYEEARNVTTEGVPSHKPNLITLGSLLPRNVEKP